MAEETCPPATQDIALNLDNRKNAIDTAMYGPLNPAEPNEEYWSAIADEWKVDTETAKKQVCGNCAVFIQTPQMLDCIATGLTGEQNDEYDSIQAAGDLGYCEAFDFKCASARTCRAWVAGGPVTAAAKKKRTISQTPAPKKDRIKGSSKNKKGSASGSRKINFSASVEKSLREKVAKHNEKASKGRRASLGMLKAVYRRGAGAYSVSHRPGMTRNQWAMGRVNAFLRLLKSGKPSNSAYVTDNDLLPSGHPRSTKKSNSITAAAGLVPEESDLAEALIEIADKYGKFNEDATGIWAGYTPPAENDVKGIGVKCSSCVLYMGNGQCRIIDMEVEDEGKCRFAVIPDGVVDVGVLEGEKLGNNIQSERELAELAEQWSYQQELEANIGNAEDYPNPEDAILALTEYSNLGYEAEHAIRASWLRAVRNGEDPFKRAALLASLGEESLDADLLPTDEEE
jgi:hypothetical protein